MPFLNADARHPLVFPDGTIHREMVHLAQVITHPNIEIGAYSYANDFDPPDDWARQLAPYLYPGAPERLIIGRFCQIAHGVRFITASANHVMTGFSTYPFGVFSPNSFQAFRDGIGALPDTVVGHDVWIGHGALILPGAQIGSGVIIGAGAVVSGCVPDYAIVAGNPARILRPRFAPDVVRRLMELCWWDQPLERIEAALPALLGADIAVLEAAFAP